MKQKIKYRRITVIVDVPYKIRKGICAVCNRRVGKEIKVTHLHHWKYSYSTKRVRENPLLALENTIELCFPHHVKANALVDLTRFKDGEDISRILELAPQFISNRFFDVVRHLYNEVLEFGRN